MSNLIKPMYVGVTGLELATPWSQTRCSSQTELHPVSLIILAQVDKIVKYINIFKGVDNI